MSWQTSRLEDSIACLNPPGISNRLWHSSHPAGVVCCGTAALLCLGSSATQRWQEEFFQRKSASYLVTLIRSFGNCRDERGHMKEIHRYALLACYMIKAHDSLHVITKILKTPVSKGLCFGFIPSLKQVLLKYSKRNKD